VKNVKYGFTLVEVLVALIILSISLGSIFQALSSSRRISLKADESLTAVRIAHNLLANPILIPTALKDLKVSGAIENETEWHYTLSVKPLEFNTGNRLDIFLVPNMFELNLCLSHQTNDREKIFCAQQWYRNQ
jgi:prepilin-type N-terminal cleavage/methylation domain-containing protein